MIYQAVTKLNMTSELFVTGGFRKPNVRKNLFENNYEREKGPYLQFHKLYDSTWVITTDFCSINLVEGEANETPRETISFMIHFIICTRLLWSDEPAFRENKFYRFDMTWCNYIITYCELQGVNFQKLVLPHDDIVQSLYTFLKGFSISEALLSNTNPNNWGNSLVSRNIVLPLLQS